MKHYFSTVNNVVLTHSDMESTAMGRKVRVYFERSNNEEFDFAEGELPAAEFSKTYGFSQNELLQFKRYLKNNSFLIWEYAQKGGGLECLKS
jgi:hypothetical protein